MLKIQKWSWPVPWRWSRSPASKLSYLGEVHENARARDRSWYQSDPPENQTCHTDEEGASLACYQSTLFSGTSFFSQWYFPSSERSTNEILWEIVASSPFLCPSRLRRSLARSRETRFARPNTQIGELARRLWSRNLQGHSERNWKKKNKQTNKQEVSQVFKSNGLKILDVIKPHKRELQAIHELSLITNCPIFSQQSNHPPDGLDWAGDGKQMSVVR